MGVVELPRDQAPVIPPVEQTSTTTFGDAVELGGEPTEVLELHKLMLAVAALLLGALLVTGAAGATGRVKAVRVSHCPGPPNAEVVQAVRDRHADGGWFGVQAVML